MNFSHYIKKLVNSYLAQCFGIVIVSSLDSFQIAIAYIFFVKRLQPFMVEITEWNSIFRRTQFKILTTFPGEELKQCYFHDFLLGRINKGKKPFECNNCDSSFRQTGGLKIHVASVHEGKKPFACNICDSSFTQKGYHEDAHSISSWREKAFSMQRLWFYLGSKDPLKATHNISSWRKKDI